MAKRLICKNCGKDCGEFGGIADTYTCRECYENETIEKLKGGNNNGNF
jgi:hypothetical protein